MADYGVHYCILYNVLISDYNLLPLVGETFNALLHLYKS